MANLFKSFSTASVLLASTLALANYSDDAEQGVNIPVYTVKPATVKESKNKALGALRKHIVSQVKQPLEESLASEGEAFLGAFRIQNPQAIRAKIKERGGFQVFDTKPENWVIIGKGTQPSKGEGQIGIGLLSKDFTSGKQFKTMLLMYVATSSIDL